jgi:hypothetical protein
MPIIVHVTITFQICMKVQSDIGLVEKIPNEILSITNVLFHLETIDNYMIFFYFHSFMLTNGKLMKKPWKNFTRLVFMN